jgi:hypothetical protein
VPLNRSGYSMYSGIGYNLYMNDCSATLSVSLNKYWSYRNGIPKHADDNVYPELLRSYGSALQTCRLAQVHSYSVMLPVAIILGDTDACFSAAKHNVKASPDSQCAADQTYMSLT